MTAAAFAAVSRLDDGVPQPGDELIAAVFETHCRWAEYEYHAARDNAERAAWLAGQCGGCEEGGTGEPCDLHDGGEGGA